MALLIDPTFIGVAVVAVVVIVVVFILSKSSGNEKQDDRRQQKRQPQTKKEPKVKRSAQKKKQFQNYAGDGKNGSGYDGEDSSEEDLLKLHSLSTKTKKGEQKAVAPSKPTPTTPQQEQKPTVQEQKKKSKDKKGDDEAEDKNYVTIKRKPQKPGQEKKPSDEEPENKDPKDPKDEKNDKKKKGFYSNKVLRELRIEAKGGKLEDEPEEKEKKGRKKRNQANEADNNNSNNEEKQQEEVKEGQEKKPPRKPRDPNAPPRPPRDPNAPPRQRRPDGEKPERVPRPVELPSLIYHEPTANFLDEMLNAITQSESKKPVQKNVIRKPLGERPPRKPKTDEKKPQKPQQERKKIPNGSVFSKLDEKTILRILGYLEAKDLVALSMVCQYFYRVSTFESLWRALCQKENIKRTHRGFYESYYRAKSAKPALAENVPPKKEWQQLPPVQKAEL